MSIFDLKTEKGRRAERRMREELVGWLTTVAKDGTPQSSVVAFLWDGEKITVYSDPSAPKVRNLIENHGCSFHLNSDRHGLDVVTLTGTVAVQPNGPRWNELSGFREKYENAFDIWGLDLDESADRFSQLLVITPVAARVW